MAVTKLLNIKEGKNSSSKHLYASIKYIMNPNKTDESVWIGGNAGSDPQEVYATFMNTKEEWGKKNGRQGYHFIISFEKGETNEEKAYEVTRKFCKEYLGDRYDFVFSVHNDKEHMHGHIVFNSVGRIDGYKYRYEKGDWEKHIQPITNRLCKEHGLKKLVFEEKRVGKSYAEHLANKEGRLTWNKIIKKDIDFAIKKSDSFDGFLNVLEDMEYKYRFGKGKKGEYVTFYPPDSKKGHRDYKLGSGYTIGDIKKRILLKEHNFHYDTRRIKKHNRVTRRESGFKNSRYQVVKVRQLYQAKYYHALNPYRVDAYKVRKDLLNIRKLSEQCRYLMQHDISNKEDLESRLSILLDQEKLYKFRPKLLLTDEEQRAQSFHQRLSEQLENTKDEGEKENIEDQLDQLEASYPEDLFLYVGSDQEALKIIKNEKRIINSLKREQVEFKVVRAKKEERKKIHDGARTRKAKATPIL